MQSVWRKVRADCLASRQTATVPTYRSCQARPHAGCPCVSAACAPCDGPRALHARARPVRTCRASHHDADTSGSCEHNPSLSEASSPDADHMDWVVVNFYHLVEVPEPQKLVEEHRVWLEQRGLNVKGRIYISSQGVNAQFGGPKAEALAYTEWFQENSLFKNLRFSVWPATGEMFPKLRLKYKPNLISLAGGMEGLPITDPQARAKELEPAAWKDMIAGAEERKIVVLDVRNGYEWDAGHFKGAERPAEEIFNETPVGATESDIPEPLRGAPADTPVMMYCTGGIRCDVYSTFLRSKGFNNLYTLGGGIQNYLRNEGSNHWNGSLYVFDGRMAISANAHSPAGTVDTAESGDLPAAVPCQVCGAPGAQLPHMNCANVDCNELFIACAACKTRYNGCCCEACMSAPRLLRPVKMDGGHYGQWGNYAEGEDIGSIMSAGRSREGRVARRARRREVIKDKRSKQLEERAAIKAQMRDAMAKLEEHEEKLREGKEGLQAAGAR